MNEVCAPERTGEAVAVPARRYLVAPITIAQAIEAGAAEMFVRHWDEVEVDKDVMDLDIDWPRMFELEALGYSKSFGVWTSDALVGYSLFHITPNIHSRTVIQGVNDVLFVEREHRGDAGVRLIRTAERLLKELGVRKLIYNAKVEARVGRKGSTTGDLLLRMRYRLDEEVYSKLL